jgi:hypothetical protein
MLVVSPFLVQVVLAVPANASATCSWFGTPQPIPAGQYGGLADVAVLSRCNVWAVGTSPPHTLIEHWNGSSWTIQPSPNFGTGSNGLGSVDASSSRNIWAIGSYATSPAGDVILPPALHCC